MPNKNYYQILGTNETATPEEIRIYYDFKMREIPVEEKKIELGIARGLNDTYRVPRLEAELKVLEQQIEELTEAFEVLSSPLRRKEYDESLKPKPKVSPPVPTPVLVVPPATVRTSVSQPKPIIVIRQKRIDFGSLQPGQKQVQSFIIENTGGPASKVDIDWEAGRPDWADLTIERDPVNTFPIKVSVMVDTSRTPPGAKLGKIKVSVDD